MRRWYCGVPGGPRGAAACAAVCQRGLWCTAPTEMNEHNAGNLLGSSGFVLALGACQGSARAARERLRRGRLATLLAG